MTAPSAPKRRICWPNPDATCLEGGCLHCNDYPLRSVSAIRRYAQHAGEVHNRAAGQKNALEAFKWGQRSGWPNIDQRPVVKGSPL